MKKLRNLLALVFVLLFAVSAVPAAGAAEDAAAFVPVMRFVASSDTHVRDDSDMTRDRIGKMMALAYAKADADPNYQNVDALLVAGDLTNDGTKTEFEKFQSAINAALRPETAFLAVVAKNHDGYELSREELRAFYKQLSGNDTDFHTVIGGFHFIGVSVSANKAAHYDAKQLSWLKQQLDIAVADTPDKPVFVTHHEHNTETVYGSSVYEGWGVPYFKAILNQYPQVVDFSGHSHFPLNDPRSVWQGKYTAVGTGAIYYSEFTVEGLRCYHPADSEQTATCWIVEANAGGDLHLQGMDVEAGKVLCDYVLKNPSNPANRDYTPKKQKAASKAPVFASDAAITAAPTFGGCTVTVDAAQSADGMPVVLYRAAAKNRLGVTVSKTWTMPQYYRAVEQNTIDLELQGLSAGDYTVSVVAETAYGVQSAPLQTTVHVDGETGFAYLVARIRLLFASIKDFFVHLFW